MKLNSNPDTSASAGIDMKQGLNVGARLKHHYEVECYAPDGTLKWKESFDNLVPTAGRNKYLDATIKTGLSSPSWNVGLVDNSGFTSYDSGDTMGSHSGWSESTAYSNAARPAYTPGTVASGSVDNSASKATFTINGSATIRGAFIVDNSTKGGTTGTLLGVGDFAASRQVQANDTLNVTITLSIS